MAKFRCPRCGAVVEGLHDRCPRCKVLFKYRKEDIDLLTPYKSQGPEVPELIEEKKVEEPLPPVQEPAPVEEKQPEPIKEEPVVVEEKQPEPVVDYSKNKKAKKTSLVFGILGLVFDLLISSLIGLIFGIVALAQAKKAKPIKASGGKALGIIDLILGILGLLAGAFLAFLIFVAIVAGVVVVILNWDVIAPQLGLALALL